MKISEPTVTYKVKEINITSASYLTDYKIEVRFDDGKKNIIDFEEFLSQSKHPDIRKYLKKKSFKKFKIDNGNLNWNNYDLIFPINDLYNGNIN